MSTLNQVATALAGAIDGVIRAAPAVKELLTPPAAEVLLNSRSAATSCDQLAEWSIEISYQEKAGWAHAVTQLRLFLDHEGASSIEALLSADRTLGGVVSTLDVTSVTGERRVQFADGFRIVGLVNVTTWYH